MLILIKILLQSTKEIPADLENIFKDLLSCLSSAPAPSNSALKSELDQYLNTDPETVKDPLLWWVKKKAVYPCLLCMACNYLSILGKYYFILIKFIKFINSYLQQHPLMLSKSSVRPQVVLPQLKLSIFLEMLYWTK